jgi:DNA mismatch repair protein MutL
MTIRILSQLVTNQIAAGEVVERPASVIKEMVENSLDAGATKIEIEIAGGGKTLIRIRDNGCGIPRDELVLALTRHATSKIVDVDDLSAIVSFGFRGEALASVASVSRLTLISKPHEQPAAWQIRAEGVFEEPDIQPASHPDGTTVIVRDLFFNVPPRRRFLKSDRTEIQHIVHFFKTFAIGNPAVAFTLISDGRTLYSLPPAVEEKQRLQRLNTLFGKGFADNQLNVYMVRNGMTLSGFVLPAKPDESTDVEVQFLFLNGRPIREKNTMHAIRQAYAGCYGRDVKINYILFLTMDPSEVDVNVHPTKHDVRFVKQREVHDFFVIAVQQALSDAGIATEEGVKDNAHAYQNQEGTAQPGTDACGEDFTFGSGSIADYSSCSPGSGSFGGTCGTSSGAGKSCSDFSRSGRFSSSSGSFGAYTDWMGGLSDHEGRTNVSDPVFREETLSSSSGQPKAVIYGICDSSVCAGYDQDLYVFRMSEMDRLHLKEVYRTGALSSALIVPVQIKLESAQIDAMKQNEKILISLGFSVQFKGNSLRIVCVPDCLRRYDIAGIMSAFSEAVTGCSDEESLRTAVIDAAVKKRSYTLVDAVNLFFNSGINLDDFFSGQKEVSRISVEQLIKDRNAV